MANSKISALPDAETIVGTEEVPVVQEEETRRATLQEIFNALQKPDIIQFACSDLVTALEVSTSVGYCRAPRAMTLTGVRASLLTASSSGVVTIDINKNGVTMLSTKLTIDANEKTSVTAAAATVISVAAIADDDEITVDIDGAGTGAAGLVVTLIGTPT